MRTRKTLNWTAGPTALAAMFLISFPALVFPQVRTPVESPVELGKASNFIFSGSIGLYGELYDKSNGPSRRPGSTSRLFFRPTFSLFRSVSVSSDIILSSEGSSNRQNINQFDFNPKWSWGSAHLGDFTDTYSSLTLNGIRIRGGGLAINPKKFRFSALGGQTRRATSNSSASRSFSRNLFGGRIGVGKNGGSWIDLIMLKSKDKASSLPPLEGEFGVVDTAQNQNLANPWSQFPEENFITAISSNLLLFGGKIKWGNELSGSAFTRNTHGGSITDEKIPSWTEQIFKIHTGSRVDVAYKTDLGFSSRAWNVTSGYEFVGPGYVSLGLSSLMSDRQAFRLGGALRQRNWSVNLNYARENDNLLNQKTYTTVRQRFGGTISVKPVTWWNVIFSGNFLNMGNSAANDTMLIDNTNVVVGLNQTFILNYLRIQTLSINYINQSSSDSNPLRIDSRLRSQTFDLRLTIKAASQITVTPSVGVVASRIGSAGAKTTTIVSVNAQCRALGDRLTAGLTTGPTFANDTRLYRTTLTGAYKLTSADLIQTDLRLNNFSNKNTTNNYNETIWSIGLTHQF